MGKMLTISETNEFWDVDNDGLIVRDGKRVNHSAKQFKTEKEPDYVKVFKYTNTVFAFKGIPLNLVPVIIEISKYMTYASDGQTVILNKAIKEEICGVLGIKENRLNKMIKQLADNDVLRRTSYRGMYAVNPFICSCGEAVKTKELQAKFDYDADLMTVNKIETNLITGKVVNKAIKEIKRHSKQIEGQQSIDENYPEALPNDAES